MRESVDSVSDIGDPRFGVRIEANCLKFFLTDSLFFHLFVIAFRRHSLGGYNIPGTSLGGNER